MNIECVMYIYVYILEKKIKEYFYDCFQLSEIFMEQVENRIFLLDLVMIIVDMFVK